MTDQRLAVFLIGHPVDDDYEPWLHKRLAFAKVTDVAGGTGTWSGLPCRVTHRNDDESGPLFVAVDAAAFDIAMTLAPTERELPPPLSTFVDACEDVRPTLALLSAGPIAEDSWDDFATDAAALADNAEFGGILELPCTAVYLNGFGVIMLDEPPAVTTVEVAHGGAVYLTGWRG
ncbi:hypothetical protein [Actinoplanes sp. NPDC049265]|uniref:hypothetical protein n=1 Tax=Actinoplanes sp. NPDC049265 TaxID=3363902 RepID=UPI0037217633